jgi:uncharacterized protein YbjT (DUF2867 family)
MVRATQFHEFPAQILVRTQTGPFAVVPRMEIQPIAARRVGETLMDVATNPTGPQTVGVAVPEAANLVDRARTFIAHRGQQAAVIPLSVPGTAGKAMKVGALLPTPDVPTTGPTLPNDSTAPTVHP